MNAFARFVCRILGHKFGPWNPKSSYRTCHRCQTTWLWTLYKRKVKL